MSNWTSVDLGQSGPSRDYPQHVWGHYVSKDGGEAWLKAAETDLIVFDGATIEDAVKMLQTASEGLQVAYVDLHIDHNYGDEFVTVLVRGTRPPTEEELGFIEAAMRERKARAEVSDQARIAKLEAEIAELRKKCR